MISLYIESLNEERKPSSPLFQPVKDNTTGKNDKAMTADGVYKVVRKYTEVVGLKVEDGFGVHSLRATVATNALYWLKLDQTLLKFNRN